MLERCLGKLMSHLIFMYLFIQPIVLGCYYVCQAPFGQRIIEAAT